MRTTVIYSPHPDDETLYLAGYVAFAAHRGDRLVLVAVTDGGASGARPAGWTVADLMAVRRAEQTAAWSALTREAPQTVVHRLGLPDGGITSGPVTAMAKSLEAIYGSDVEHYVGGSRLASQSADHRAVANGVATAGVRVARYSKAPDDTSAGGTRYLPPVPALAKEADDSYRAFGHRSVAAMFTALAASGYASRIIA